MQTSIFQTLSSMWCNLTNDGNGRQSVPPLQSQPCLASSRWQELLHAASIKARESVSSSQSLAQTVPEDDAIGARCRLFQLVAPSLLWTLPLQNPCLTTTLDNSKKRKGRTNALPIYSTFSVIFGGEILPTPLPLACQLSCAPLRTTPTKCWDY